MKGRVINNKAILRIDKGDEVLKSLETFSTENNIKTASITGIGASNNITVAVFNRDEEKYISTTYDKEYYEITNFSGNITFLDYTPHAHVHITFSNNKGETFGGHLKECVIKGACEIFLDILDTTVTRKYDNETKLNLLDI